MGRLGLGLKDIVGAQSQPVRNHGGGHRDSLLSTFDFGPGNCGGEVFLDLGEPPIELGDKFARG